jgi:Peptidase family S41/Secretion system C-terminal sorting domain
MNKTLLAIVIFCTLAAKGQTGCLKAINLDPISVMKQHNLLLSRANNVSKKDARTTAGTALVFDTTRWNNRVDSTWGSGFSTAQYLNVFNAWWNTINTQYPCFIHLPNYNWDSVVTAMTATISLGVSEGRFAAICNQLLAMVNDSHTNFYDYNVNYPWELYPGLPVFRGESGNFGACITTLNDSLAMVYDAYPNHPFGLVPGDVILGYNGYSWNQLVQIILRNGLPNSVFKGSTDSATKHRYIQAAGENWYLFDTINIRKCDGTIQNLPTSLMEGKLYQAFCTEQIAQEGVYKPNYNDYYNNHMDITYGKLAGTNIGYVYMYDCEDTTHLLYRAFKTLIEDSLVEGLILDIRTNFGGGFGAYVDAFEYLAASGTAWVGYGQRSSTTNRFAMYNDGRPTWYNIYDDFPQYYPKPIAILCGPNAVSAGDFLPVMFKHIPNVRLFGKSTAGAFGNLTGIALPLSNYIGSMQQTNFFQTSDTTLYLSHTEFPVDQTVWFNQSSVCSGTDNIVSSAVQWIHQQLSVNTVAAESLTVKLFPNPAENQITIAASGISSNSAITFQITDELGRLFDEKNTTIGRALGLISFDVANYPSGLYFVKVSCAGGNSLLKFVKN